MEPARKTGDVIDVDPSHRLRSVLRLSTSTLRMADYDLAILGGGLNGAGIARDAAGRGLRVILLEQGDLGSGASSASPRLIHGDLSVLERRDFFRVRSALSERDGWLKDRAASGAADALCDLRRCRRTPALARGPGCRSTTGSARAAALPASATIDVTHHPVGDALKRPSGTAFEYSDCVVDDSRRSCSPRWMPPSAVPTIRTGARCVRADREHRHWRLVVIDRELSQGLHRQGAGDRHRRLDPLRSPTPRCARRPRRSAPPDRPDRGAPPVRQRHVYVFQNHDRRLIFASPYERDFTLIGTIGHAFKGDPAIVSMGATRRLSLRRRQPLFPRAGRHLYVVPSWSRA